MHPGNHRPVTKEHFHLVITSLYLLLLRYMELLTKGAVTNHVFFLHQTVYSARCLEHLGALQETLFYGKGLCIWKKGWPRQISGAAFTQAIQQQTLVMSGLLRSYLFLCYQHQILNCRKNTWVFWYHGSEFSSWIRCFCSALPFPTAKHVSTLPPHPPPQRW